MKKILMAAIAVTLGLMAQAAKVSWSVDYTYIKGSTDAAEGWQVVFFDNNEVSTTAFISSLATGEYKDYVSTYGGMASDLTDSDGYADGISKKTTYGNPETITGYFVLFDSADYNTATFAYVSATADATTGATTGQNASLSFGDVTATQVAGNWTAVAPEPTSGLLMLLGMAGLALKRKRA